MHLVSEPSCTNNCTNKQTLKTHYSAAPAKPLLFCYLHFFFIRTIQELCSVTALYKTCGSTKTEEDWSVGRPVAQCCFYDSSPSLISYQLASCRTSAPWSSVVYTHFCPKLRNLSFSYKYPTVAFLATEKKASFLLLWFTRHKKKGFAPNKPRHQSAFEIICR